MILYLAFCVGITSIYVGIIAFISSKWDRQEEWVLPSDYIASTAVTVVIAARNEEKNLPACIASILHNYPAELLEIIIVDDHSDDDSRSIVASYNDRGVRSLSLQDKTGKKAAIDLGVRSARGTLIMTTDADCVVPKNWIDHVISYYQDTQASVIAGPVKFSYKNSFLEKFQALDFMGMMAVTQAGIFSKKWFMANGANLAYTKDAFLSINGYADNNNFASGDDMFLIQKVAQSKPECIYFLHSNKACVETPSESTLNKFIKQRIRWGTKNSAFKDWGMLYVLGSVFLFCLSIITNLYFSLFLGKTFFIIMLLQVVVKTVTDFFYLKKLSLYFSKANLMKSFILSNLAHIAYITTIGVLSIFVKNYTWKDRHVR